MALGVQGYVLHGEKAYTGYFFALAAASFWALLGPVSCLPLGHGVSPLEVAFWRAVFGAAFFIAHGMARGQYRVRPREGLALGLFGVVGIGALFPVYQVAVQRGGAALASILLYTAPFWVAAFSRLFFRERLTPLKSAALVLAMAGVALVCLSGGGLPEKADLFGIFCGLLSGLAYSMHYVFGRIYLQRVSAVAIYMYCLLAGALALLPLVEFAPKRAGDWAAFLALGFFCTYAAYWAYCEGLKRLAPTRVAVLCNLEPILATLLAFLFWDEFFHWMGWVGAVMVFAAIFMIMAESSRRSDRGEYGTQE